MSEQETFIIDAIEGGWNKIKQNDFVITKDESGITTCYFGKQKFSIYQILLDPKAWCAVGKKRKWSKQTVTYKIKAHRFRAAHSPQSVMCKESEATRLRYPKGSIVWKTKQRYFIHFLSKRKTIDQALLEMDKHAS